MRAKARLAREAAAAESASAGDRAFWARLGRKSETIERLAEGLYGSMPGWEGFLERLDALLLEKHRERPAALKALDLERETAPKPWYLAPGLAAYQLYLDRFAGDLAGLRARLPYLEELGVRLLHLMPFFKSPPGPNDGGYAVSDYRVMDEALGTMPELARTAELLHGRGMYLAADLVLNHSADDHPWALAAKAGDRRCRGFYYVFEESSEIEAYEASMPEIFPAVAPGNFTWLPELEAWVMTVFHSYQWDLNWSNPELFLEMLGILLDLGNLGIDLLRLDAVPYLWKRAGTACRNLPEAHDIVRLLKAAAEVAAPGLAFLAEAIVSPAEILTYLDAEGVEECQLAYHASLMALLWEALATRKTGLLAASLRSEPRLAPGTAWISYVRCHDDIGLGYEDRLIEAAGYGARAHRRFLLDYYSGRFPGSEARGRLFMEDPETGDARISGTAASLAGLEAALSAEGEEAGARKELALRRIELLYGLAASIVGIPMIYAGDELGSLNDYGYEAEPELAADNRWMHRPRLRHSDAEARKLPGSLEARLFGSVARALGRRAGLPALAPDAGFEVQDSPSENLLLVLRRPLEPGPPLLVIANFAPEPRSLPAGLVLGLVGTAARELLSDSPLADRAGLIEIPAYGLLWAGEKPADRAAREEKLPL